MIILKNTVYLKENKQTKQKNYNNKTQTTILFLAGIRLIIIISALIVLCFVSETKTVLLAH